MYFLLGTLMLVASTKSTPRVMAWLANREMAPFYCPECKKEVVLHKGQLRDHHFKHKPPVTCSYGSGETSEHFLAKRSLYEELLADKRLKNVDIELIIQFSRPDVYFEIGSTRVAIELQKSSQSIDDIRFRTLKLNQFGIYVVWIIPSHEPHWAKGEPKVCTVQSWHEYLHMMYFGRVYFWQYGKTIRAAHLSKFYRDIPEGNWVEDYEDNIGEDLSGTNWYQENIDSANYGGGRQYVKSFKNVIWSPQCIDLIADFQYTTRNPFITQRFDVPKCNLWIDKFKAWWPKDDYRA
jgi:competence protein CoiA